jgi:hypothetical protein
MEANPALLFDGAIPPALIREHFITKRGHFSGCEARCGRATAGRISAESPIQAPQGTSNDAASSN